MRDRLILDGGLATELEARGHDLSDALWSARLLRDDPGAIRDVHRAYVDAGADCVITATYQATLDALGREPFFLATRLARESGAEFVAASVGPYGASRADGSEYTGAYDLGETGLYRWHRDRFRLLVGSGADLLACETIPSFPEARALARLMLETPGARAWFSFCCRDEAHVADGTPLAECVRFLEPIDSIVAVGINCTAPRHVVPLLDGIETGKRVVAYPNSGEAWDPQQRRWTGERDPVAFAEAARTWPADWIGGCCRVGPDHVRQLAAALYSDE